MLLQKLEISTGAHSGELRLPDSVTRCGARPLPTPVPVDTLLSGLTGAMFGFVFTLVGGALGSAAGHEMLSAFLACLLFTLAGCFYARYEHLRGERNLAEFVLAATQAGALTALVTFVSLACHSVMLLPIAFLGGMLLPTLTALSGNRS